MRFAVIKMPPKRKAGEVAVELSLQSATDLGRRAGQGANMVLTAIGEVSKRYKLSTTDRRRKMILAEFRQGLSEHCSNEMVNQYMTTVNQVCVRGLALMHQNPNKNRSLNFPNVSISIVAKSSSSSSASSSEDSSSVPCKSSSSEVNNEKVGLDDARNAPINPNRKKKRVRRLQKSREEVVVQVADGSEDDEDLQILAPLPETEGFIPDFVPSLRGKICLDARPFAINRTIIDLLFESRRNIPWNGGENLAVH